VRTFSKGGGKGSRRAAVRHGTKGKNCARRKGKREVVEGQTEPGGQRVRPQPKGVSKTQRREDRTFSIKTRGGPVFKRGWGRSGHNKLSGLLKLNLWARHEEGVGEMREFSHKRNPKKR